MFNQFEVILLKNKYAIKWSNLSDVASLKDTIECYNLTNQQINILIISLYI